MMRRFLPLMFLAFWIQSAIAQSGAPADASVSDQEIRKNTEALVLKYGLNADQAKQMYRIQKRKYRNMAEIAGFQATDVALYQAKWQNVQKGTWTSIRSILKSKEQVEIYRKTQAGLRGQRNEKRREMVAKKAPAQAVEAAVLAIYAE